MFRHAFIRHIVSKFITDFETNPAVQFTFHKFAMYFWVVNLIVVTICLFFFPSIWERFNIYYVAIVSLYANWDTDYDAMSASGAWRETQKLTIVKS